MSNTEKLTKSKIADLVMKFAFLFTNIFTDVKVKQVGKTLSLAKGDGGAIGSVRLQYGACFVEFNSSKNEYIVVLQPHDDTLGTIRLKKDSGGFHILSDLKNDFGTVDYMVVKSNET